MSKDDPIYDEIPSRFLESLQMYEEHGVPTGGFLRSLLENRPIMEVIARADDDAVRVLKPLAMYIYNAMPGACSGSQQRVEAWIARHHVGREAEKMRAVR